ncbi:MAG: hypothetical protein IJ980_06205, partial [Oscillospiraceae bacterium]|nr:hypothetical protein [Oscillospiraceae bacterium]
MDSVIYNPLEAYEKKLRESHANAVNAFFEDLVKRSNVDIEENRKTVSQYNAYKGDLVKLKKKLTLWRVLRVLMCISLILIPVVILKTTPKIKGLREEIEQAGQKAEELLAQAYSQMSQLNSLFS